MFGLGKVKKVSFEELPEEIQEKLELVEIEFMEGNDPIDTFQYVADKYPGFLPARLNYASLLLDRGDTQSAKEVYTKVKKQFPDEAGAIAGLATVFAEEGDFAKAAPLAKQAIESGYDWPPCYEVIAKSLEHNGDSNEAAESYLLGYRKSPHSWDFLQNYCRLKGLPFTPPTEDIEPCITMEQLDSLATYVDETANTPDSSGNPPGCDHTFRFAEKWSNQNNVDPIQLYQFLNAHGGFCDCEICFNVTQLLDEDFDN